MEINELQNKLENYEKEINDSEKKKASLEGKQEIVLEKLQKEYSINDFEKIDEEIKKSQEENAQIEKEIKNDLDILKKYTCELWGLDEDKLH